MKSRDRRERRRGEMVKKRKGRMMKEKRKEGGEAVVGNRMQWG